MATTDNILSIALNAVDAALPAYADDSQRLVAAKCRGLLCGYHARWKDAGYEAASVERVYWSDLFNPDTARKSKSFRVAGKIDVLATLGGRSYIIDHKTTSQDITDPDAPFWRQLVVEGQVTHYMLLQWLNGEKTDGAVWDAIRKPGISPKKLAKAERASAVSGASYFGYRLTDDERFAFAGSEERETLPMYEARLAHDCTVERPEWYFQRRPIPRLDGEVLEYAKELWGHGQELLHVRQTERHSRNSGACMLYGSPCKFLGICSGHDSADSDKWRRKSWVHAELPVGETDGCEVLTNSRIRNFQTCRRKHYYDYELAIERQDEEEREALFFGSLIHEGLRAWWECFLPAEARSFAEGCNVHGNQNSPTTAVGKSAVAARGEAEFSF